MHFIRGQLLASSTASTAAVKLDSSTALDSPRQRSTVSTVALDTSFVFFFLPKSRFIFSSFFAQISTKFHRNSFKTHQEFALRMVSKINMKSEIFDKIFSLFFAEGADSAPDRQQSQRARGEQRGVGRPLQALPAALLHPPSAHRVARCATHQNSKCRTRQCPLTS